MLKLDEPFRNQEIFIISLFFNSSDLGFERIFVVDNFAPPDPVSQNLANPTDPGPDPKHRSGSGS